MWNLGNEHGQYIISVTFIASATKKTELVSSDTKDVHFRTKAVWKAPLMVTAMNPTDEPHRSGPNAAARVFLQVPFRRLAAGLWRSLMVFFVLSSMESIFLLGWKCSVIHRFFAFVPEAGKLPVMGNHKAEASQRALRPTLHSAWLSSRLSRARQASAGSSPSPCGQGSCDGEEQHCEWPICQSQEPQAGEALTFLGGPAHLLTRPLYLGTQPWICSSGFCCSVPSPLPWGWFCFSSSTRISGLNL